MVSAVSRVHVVPNPVISRGALGGGIKHRLKFHEGGPVFFGEIRYDLLPFEDAIRHRGLRFYERSAQHQFERGIRGFCCHKDALIRLFVRVKIKVFAVVVHPDENAQKIGEQIQCIFFPAFFEVQNGVSADPPVDEFVDAEKVRVLRQ